MRVFILLFEKVLLIYNLLVSSILNVIIFSPVQLGQLIMYYTREKVLPFAFFYLTRPSKTGKESFLRQILLSDLRIDTYDWKQTKIWMIF